MDRGFSVGVNYFIHGEMIQCKRYGIVLVCSL